jgi:hypothetical protein
MAKPKPIDTDGELRSIEQAAADAADLDVSGHPMETARAFALHRQKFLTDYRSALALAEVYKRMGSAGAEIATRQAELARKAREAVLAVDLAVKGQPDDVQEWYPLAIRAVREDFAARADQLRDAFANE